MSGNKINEYLKWELKNQFYKYKVNDFPIYMFIRQHLFQTFLAKENDFSLIIRGNQVTAKRKKLRLNFFYYSFETVISFINNFRNNKYIGISSSINRVNYDGKYYDKFLSPIFSNLEGGNSIIEFPNIENESLHYCNSSEKVLHGDVLYLIEFFASKFVKFDASYLKSVCSIIVREFCKLFYNTYRIQLDSNRLEGLVYSRLKRNVKRIHIYRACFKNVNPKQVFVVSYYTPRNLIIGHILRCNGAKIIDVQHSHIYPEHISYRYPKSDLINVLPDYFLVQGELYEKYLKLNGIAGDRIIVSGRKEYEQERILSQKLDFFLKKNEGKKVMMIINQFTVSKIISEFLSDAGKYKNDIVFIVKLHPRNIQEQLKEFSQLKASNVIITCEDEFDAIASKSDCFAGVYSTGLIEVLKYNCSVFRIKKDTFPQLDSLVEEGYMVSIYKLSEVFDRLFEEEFDIKGLYRKFEFDKIRDIL